jgi:hypothetical protein
VAAAMLSDGHPACPVLQFVAEDAADRHGVPLAVRTAGADDSDQTRIIPLVADFPKVAGRVGRPKEHPDALCADRGYDCDATRWLLAWLGVRPHTMMLARRHRLSSYDASYLKLALGESLSLASLDDDLNAAAKAAGAPLYRP